MRNGFTTLSMQIGRKQLGPSFEWCQFSNRHPIFSGQKERQLSGGGGCKKKKNEKRRLRKEIPGRKKRGGRKEGTVWNPNEWLYVVAVPKAFYKVIWMGLVSER
jgi:hypothetical protein